MNRTEDIDEIKKLYSITENMLWSEEKKYRYLTQKDPDIIAYKKKVFEIVQTRNLTSYMNDTKWLELRKDVQTLKFLPQYFEKLLTDQEFKYNISNVKSTTSYGDWSPFYMEGMPLFFEIEYIVVIPRHEEYVGRLVPGKVTDITEDFRKILMKNNIYYEMEQGHFIIYGYK